MNLNEDTYFYIRRVVDQIEGLTCALIVFIENAGSYLESYHYEAFNKFSNEIRDMEISVSQEIKDEFLCIKEAIEKSALQIRASDSSVDHLRTQLSETENVFSRLVIHSHNIREINSDTSNPYVPNASDEVYRAFSGYNTLLNQYQVNVPDENDPICTLMYPFYCTVNSLFEKLFQEYDTLLQDFGVDVENKKERLAILTTIKKREISQDIAKATFDFAKTAAFARLGIKKKSDVFESGIGLIAKINKNLEELDELKFAKPKKSFARKAIKKIAVYNDAMELVGGINKIGENVVGTVKTLTKNEGADFEIPTFEKLAVAALVTLKGSKELEAWKESGQLDIVLAAVKATGNFSKIVFGIAADKTPYEIIQEISDFGTNFLDLVEKTAKYVAKNNLTVPKAVNNILHSLGDELIEYDKKVMAYKIDNEKKLLASKKPKAPPFITAKDVFKNLKRAVDVY